jgi:hypothetical protein
LTFTIVSYMDMERGIAPDYPLRAIRVLVDEVLAALEHLFDAGGAQVLYFCFDCLAVSRYPFMSAL